MIKAFVATTLTDDLNALEDMKRAPISVVIPCYCCSNSIGRALSSVAAQTLLPHEVILVEDASPDGGKTLDTLHHLANEYGDIFLVVVVTLQQNSGPASARNRGWEAATQPWLAFLDADDAWHPRKLEIQWAWLESHPEVALCGHASQFSAGQVDFPVENAPLATRLSARQMLVSNRLPTRSVMLRRDLPFRFSSRRFSEDYLLWLEMIYAGYPAYRLEAPLAFCFRPEFSPGGISGNLWQHERGEISVLRVLWKEGKMGLIVFCLAVAWSFAKFLRRKWIVRRMG
jgi:glycosyltransferase involved in cell wall biosynthesis